MTTSCQTPGFAISSSEVRRGDPLHFAVTGPDRAVVVAIDAATVSADLTATPLAGTGDPQVDRIPVTMSSCKGSGELGVQVAAGDHTISVFPAEGGTPLVSRKLTVTDR